MRYLATLLACVCGLLLASAVEAQETVTFKLNPLVRQVTVVKSVSTTTMNGEETERTVEEERYRNTAKRTDAGFSLTETLFSATKTTNGEEDEISEFTRCFLNVDVGVETDRTGKLLAIRGLEKLSAKAKNIFSPDDYKLFGPMFSEKTLKEVITDDWNTQVGALVGRTAKVSDNWDTKGRMPLPDGKYAAVTTSTTMAGFKTVNGKRYVRLSTATTLDLKAMSKALTFMLRTLPRPDGMPAPSVVATRYTLTGERLVDPNTLESLEERSTEIRESTITVKGLGSFEMVETEEKASHQEADSTWKAPGLDS
jgi:hypothetical protein